LQVVAVVVQQIIVQEMTAVQVAVQDRTTLEMELLLVVLELQIKVMQVVLELAKQMLGEAAVVVVLVQLAQPQLARVEMAQHITPVLAELRGLIHSLMQWHLLLQRVN
jgi:hypothetical protein